MPAKNKKQSCFASVAAQRVRLWRLRGGKILTRAAHELGLSATQLHSYEEGRSMPNIRNAVAIERVCGVALWEWLAPADPENAREIARLAKGA